jgi:DNA repair protein RecO (recombination protein O)
MSSYTDEGIVLKRINTGEADRIITIFTKSHGKIRALGKGIRRITSRRSGNLELFNLAELHLHKGRNLDIITEAATIKSHILAKSDLHKVALAYLSAEIIDKLTPDDAPNREIFFLLSKYFSELSSSDAPGSEILTERLAISVLESLGFWQRGKPFVGDWKKYIESIIEKPLRTPKLLNRISGKIDRE